MNSPSNSPTTLQLGLFRAYFFLLRRLDRFHRLIWIPVFRSRQLRLIRIPVFRIVVVLVLASGHMKRVVEALDRAYQQRRAINGGEEDGWKALHEQAESMKTGLPPILFSRWALVICAFFLVYLSSRILPPGDIPLASKLIAAAVTLNPEKLAELAADVGAPQVIARLFFWVVTLFIAVIPILVYHFRFKRMLFNSPAEAEVTLSIVWKQKFTSPLSIYSLENDLFTALECSAVREIPFDLLAAIIAFGFYSLGPGLVVGFVAAEVFPKNRGVGWLLFSVAGINLLIGLSNVAMSIQEIGRRSKFADPA